MKEYHARGLRCSACGYGGAEHPLYSSGRFRDGVGEGCGSELGPIDTIERMGERRGTFREVLLGCLFGDTVTDSLSWRPAAVLSGACAYCGGQIEDGKCPGCGAV